ncbi:MAG: hypothetical protein GTO14_18010, partial [Anaerolineales bacterium]|nr:hypothetical protein [Anaerolineales bacterium]
VGSANPYTVIMDTDHALTAFFAPPYGWIEGTVTDADTGLPIEGATVSVDGYSDVTDPSGFYSVEVYPGTYSVTAEMTGYVSQTEHGVSVAAGETTIVDFGLNPTIPATVALISDYSELLAITPILDSMGIGYDAYNDNGIHLYTEDLGLLLDYSAVIFYTDYRHITSDEYSALESYLSSGGNLLVTGFDCLVGDSLLADLVRSSSYGDNVGEPDLYVVDATHPIMNGLYGSFPPGYHISGLYGDCDAAEADTLRNAVTVAELADGYDKIIATEGIPGKVVFWNGVGSNDWTWNADCEAMFKNTLAWFMIRYDHELAVSLEAPGFLEPGQSCLLNATVQNHGLHNETNVELFLLIDGTEVGHVTISELVDGASYTIDYLWTPTVEATYNVTAYAPPVPGENITANNWKTEFVGVFEFVKAVVLDSWGTDYGYNAFWDYLNTNWATYGSIPVVIDYTSLNKEDITLADIEATHADVLIISDAWDYERGWEFTDSEIEAIKTYVFSGHGIIATSGTFNTRDGMAPNNRKLADLFGMDPDMEYGWGMWTSGTFDLLTPRHDELWRNVPDPYLSDSILTIYPYPSSDWTIQGVTAGWIEALSTDHYAAVITSEVYRSVYFTGMLESHGQHNENNRQLFYNAIVWTQLPPSEHELAVSLEAPRFLEPGDSSLLNATIYNLGLSNETSVELQLLINGSVVDFVVISELVSRSSHTLSYVWTPILEGTYNVTVYAPPVPGENVTTNNVYSTLITVRFVPRILAYVQFTDYYQEYANS